MQASIFTKIIKGDIPAHKVYEDAHCFAFLDIDPLLPGHVLVVSKSQVDHIEDLPEHEYDALMSAVKLTAGRLRNVCKVKRSVVMVMGYDVPHAHVHVIPSDNGRSIYMAMAERLKSDRQPPEPDHAALSALAKTLAF